MTDKITGNLIDVHNRRIFPAEIEIRNGRIFQIKEIDEKLDQYICPGFIDAHIHIESSMLVPYEFAKVALRHGTVATISDPHEIANVLGVEGVHYMIDNAKDALLKFHFGAPSCVPATSFETAGAVIDADQIETLLASDDIYYLSEMMNYPGVLHKDPEVMKKIAAAKKVGKVVDGHAPGLMGEDAKTYIEAGISTDHECFTLKEALGKLAHGMRILIREGSAAKNYEALHTLIKDYPKEIMFCSDDKHPDDLLVGHINELVVRSLRLGYELFDVLTIACKNPVEHYNMDVGLLRQGDKADFIIVENIEDFTVLETYIEGQKVSDTNTTYLPDKTHEIVNQFNIDKITEPSIQIRKSDYNAPVIEALNGELITEKLSISPTISGEFLIADPDQDILKIVVVNRYSNAQPAVGFIRNFGIKKGAIASTVAHDSHNIIAVGTSDSLLVEAINLLVDTKGGLSAVNGDKQLQIGLPIAGLMSDLPCTEIGAQYGAIDAFVKEMGSTLTAPFMTLSFMALLVIPKIKMSDQGIFDAESFTFY